jgi:YggT family protein
MVVSETKRTERVNSGVDEDGAVVREKTSSIESKANPKTTVVNLIWYVYGLIAILLALRLVLKLTGANSTNGFVSFIYAVSGALSAPFDSIFGVESAAAGSTKSVFEPSILVAIVVYGLIAWGVAKLLTLNERRSLS